LSTPLTTHAGIEIPLICGAMYPCSNPELVAAVSEAGGIGIVQPISLTYVHGHDFRAGLRLIRSLTTKPIGFNALIEASSRSYHERMTRWVDIALEEGIRFFVTSLGNPRWVAEKVHAAGGVVYHDVTERKWAEKGLAGGVDGLIAVNRRAGGHPGPKGAEQLMEELGGLGVPLVCAGGIGTPGDQAACMCCLSACKFSNWSCNEEHTTGKPPDPRSFCIQKTLHEIAHGADIESQLMFAGHNVYKFRDDPFYSNGFVPTVRQLVERIATGD
jgi:NAD(P)H-dependent flavin oxidoreductase YrpB (nitropropane dioxygenase family)